MRTTIDAAGRLVVPKALRDELGLEPGQALEARVVDGRLEVEVPLAPIRLERREGHVVAVSDEPMPVLTAELVRQVLERVRG